jgi:membrane-bound inhibitor of C-type lysozyme
MSTRRFAPCVLALLLAACGVPPPSPTTTAPVTRYTCRDGRVVTARYPDSGTARLVIDGAAHVLKIARSADGARYVGEGWQWWTKGMRNGTLAPLAGGETIASARGVACAAPQPQAGN